MTPLTRILIGLFAMAIGIIMVYKTSWIMSMVGRIYWAEKHLGGGGTRLFYKLLGTLIIIIGFMLLTNTFDLFIGGFFRRIFGA